MHMSETTENSPLRVLAAIDLTERSRNAFARAVDLARSPGAALTLVHVMSDAMPAELAAAHEAYAREVLRDLAAKARAEGVAGVEPVLARGRDFEGLIEEARKAKADLVVIGTHRPSSLVQDMLGTTADRVLRHGGLPLLLVRSKAQGPYKSLLVAVDFSPASRRALELALRWFAQARVAAVTAYGSSRRSFLGDDAQAREAAAETRRLALKGILQEVRHALGPGNEAGNEAAIERVVPMVERGWAEDVILRAAQEEKPELIVVGTHARGGLQHAVLGSVAEWVLTEAPCDVLAIPPPR
jgi:nucleotide-binding universal stress UspA family protein